MSRCFHWMSWSSINGLRKSTQNFQPLNIQFDTSAWLLFWNPTFLRKKWEDNLGVSVCQQQTINFDFRTLIYPGLEVVTIMKKNCIWSLLKIKHLFWGFHWCIFKNGLKIFGRKQIVVFFAFVTPRVHMCSLKKLC